MFCRLPVRLVFAATGFTYALAVHAQTLIEDGLYRVDKLDVDAELAALPAPARQQVLASRSQLRALVNGLLVRRSVAAEARQTGLESDPEVQRLLALAREKVLHDVHTRRLDAASRPTPQSIEAYARTTYNAQPERFSVGERVKARHILVRGTDAAARSKAEDLLAQLKAGADFAALARQHSQDPGSATRGGELGTFERGRMVPEFEAAAFGLTAPGQLSDIVQTPFGFHIIRLDERQPAGRMTFDEAKGPLMADAEQKLLTSARDALTDRILRGAKVNDAELDKIVQDARR